MENAELLIGDCIVLVNFCLFKQISAIVLSPRYAPTTGLLAAFLDHLRSE